MKIKKKIKICIILLFIGVILLNIFNAALAYVFLTPPEGKINEIPEERKAIINSFDGTELVGEQVIQGGHRWVIIVHGYHSDHTAMYDYGGYYFEKGYNIIYTDSRGHGNSGGKYVGMSYLEKEDIRCWIEYVLSKDNNAEIILHGQSMGAAAILQLSDDELLAVHVKAIISESAFTSAKSYLTDKVKREVFITVFYMFGIVDVYSKLIADYYLSDANVIERVRNSVIPILYIHGTEDKIVPVENAYELYEATFGRKQLFIVENAGHIECLHVCGDEYSNVIDKFIKLLID